MDLLSKFEQIFDSTERGFARVIGQRDGGAVVAETESGAQLILQGSIETGKACYYDKRSLKVLGEAPNAPYSEYGI